MTNPSAAAAAADAPDQQPAAAAAVVCCAPANRNGGGGRDRRRQAAAASPAPAARANLRVKKFEFRKPLRVCRAADVPDLAGSLSQRILPQVGTGVDASEESEHHLQAAISAAQAFAGAGPERCRHQHGHPQTPQPQPPQPSASSGGGVAAGAAASIYIPTPDASRLVPDYERLYRRAAGPGPANKVRFSATVEDCCSCIPYCMDEEDARWLEEQSSRAGPACGLSEDVFEIIVSTLEKHLPDGNGSGGGQVPPFDDMAWSSEYSSLREHARAVHPHWARRRALRGGPVMPTLKTEEHDPAAAPDPYVCFRRREVKPQRKGRKTDAASTEKLRRLQVEMGKARGLLEQVARRERMRRESLVIEQLIFDRRCALRRATMDLGLPVDESLGAVFDGGSAPLPRQGAGLQRTIDGAGGRNSASVSPFEILLRRRRHADSGFVDITFVGFCIPERFSAAPHEPLHRHKSHLYHRPKLETSRGKPPAGRRRIGRGGRRWFDTRGRWAVPSCGKWKHDDDWSDDEAGPTELERRREFRFPSLESEEPPQEASAAYAVLPPRPAAGPPAGRGKLDPSCGAGPFWEQAPAPPARQPSRATSVLSRTAPGAARVTEETKPVAGPAAHAAAWRVPRKGVGRGARVANCVPVS